MLESNPKNYQRTTKELPRSKIVNLPPFVYSLSFWNAVSILVAVAAVQAGYDAVTAAKVLGAILGVLQLLNITPELQAKGLA